MSEISDETPVEKVEDTEIETEEDKLMATHLKLAALAYVISLIVLGLPIWWFTTAVHRATLPYDEINNLPVHPPVNLIRAHFMSMQKDPARFQDLFKDLQKTDILSVELHLLECSEDLRSFITSQVSIEALDQHLSLLDGIGHEVDDLVFMEVPASLMPSGKEHGVVIGRHRYIYISKETTSTLVAEVFYTVLYPPALEEVGRGDKFSLALNYNILITLATSNIDADLDLKFLAESYLSPFISKLASKVANLSVSTQVIYVGNGQISADLVSHPSRAHILNEDKVASLINALEPKLGSQLSVEPTFHWVIYIPHAQQTPMEIHVGSQPVPSNSVLSPRWNGGGLQILNDPLDAHRCAELVVAQLRNSLGLQNRVSRDDVVSLSYDASGVHQWEMQSLIQRRTVQFLHNAATTLKSLCQLLAQIENIVISDAVGGDITASLTSSIDAQTALGCGDMATAYAAAQLAVTTSERAFFHQSLLALLYFPDDQKYAIYIPLFLPVGFPVLGVILKFLGATVRRR